MVIGVYRMMRVGAILSSPVVDGNVIYVGSSDGNLYALMCVLRAGQRPAIQPPRWRRYKEAQASSRRLWRDFPYHTIVVSSADSRGAVEVAGTIHCQSGVGSLAVLTSGEVVEDSESLRACGGKKSESRRQDSQYDERCRS
jgi:hypothetical protein